MNFPMFQGRLKQMIACGTSDRVWLLAVIALSVGLRIGAALYLGYEARAVSGAADEVSYDALARRFAAGHGFSFGENWWPMTRAGEPTAHWSFLYTVLLAASYLMISPVPIWSRLIQATAVGILHPWLIWRICRPFGSGVSRWAGVITAVYGYFVFYSAALVTESLYIVCILASLWVAISLAYPLSSTGWRLPAGGWSGSRSGSLKVALVSESIDGAGPEPELGPSSLRQERLSSWLMLGLFVGLAALLRQVALVFYPVLLAWILRQRRHGAAERPVAGLQSGIEVQAARIPWLGLSGSVLVVVLLIAPWTIRNYLSFNRFVPLNTNAGFALYWANHPIHGSNFIPVLPGGGPAYAELVPAEWRGLDEAALDRKLLRAGLEFAWKEPGRYLKLSLGRAREYFRFWPSSDSTRSANLARVFSFGILLPLSLGGAFLVWISPGAYPPLARSVAGLLMLFAATHTAVHLLSWGLVRYRVPADAVLVLFAAVGICALTRGGVPSTPDRSPRDPRGSFGGD